MRNPNSEKCLCGLASTSCNCKKAKYGANSQEYKCCMNKSSVVIRRIASKCEVALYACSKKMLENGLIYHSCLIQK